MVACQELDEELAGATDSGLADKPAAKAFAISKKGLVLRRVVSLWPASFQDITPPPNIEHSRHECFTHSFSLGAVYSRSLYLPTADIQGQAAPCCGAVLGLMGCLAAPYNAFDSNRTSSPTVMTKTISSCYQMASGGQSHLD